MLRQAGGFGGAGHGMPLVADAACVEAVSAGGLGGHAGGDGQHAGFAVRRVVIARGEETATFLAGILGPCEGFHLVIGGVGEAGIVGDVKVAAKGARNPGQGGVFAEDIGGGVPCEAVEAH